MSNISLKNKIKWLKKAQQEDKGDSYLEHLIKKLENISAGSN